MNENISFVGTFLFWAVLAALIIGLSVWHKNRQESKDQPHAVQRETRARQLSWRYSGVHDGDIRYQFFGTTAQGYPWVLRYDSEASCTGGVPKIYWETTAVASSRLEFILSTAQGFDVLQNPLGRGLAAGVNLLNNAFGGTPHYADFLQSESTQMVGSARLRRKYKIRARTAREVAKLFDADTESLLLNWPRTAEKNFDPFKEIKITHDTKGLHIQFKYDTSDMPLFEHIVKLGSALAMRVAQR